MGRDAPPPSVADIVSLQRLVLDFALRDQSRWDALQALFVPGAPIHVSWYSGPIEGFIAASRAMAERGSPPAKHLIATPRIDIAGDRAIGTTDVVIAVRLPTPQGELDVTSWARFHDVFAHQDGSWRIARRTAVYERDRVDPVGPATLGDGWSASDLAKYPAAYKHLAKLLERVGATIVPGTAVWGSPEEQAILDDAQAWLERGDVAVPVRDTAKK